MTKLFRIIVIMLLLSFTLTGMLCSAGCIGTSETDSTQATPEPTEGQPVIPPGLMGPGPVVAESNGTTFNGIMDQNTTMPLTAGVHLMTVKTTPPSSSAVYVETSKDYVAVVGKYSKEAEARAEDANSVTWTQAFMLEEGGDAKVEVTSASEWSVSFGVPAMIDGIPPQTFTGIGNAATPFFMIPEGNYSCTINSKDNSVLGVHLMDAEGNSLMDADGIREVPLAWHEGLYNGTMPLTIENSSNYLFNVISDGEWSVFLEAQ